MGPLLLLSLLACDKGETNDSGADSAVDSATPDDSGDSTPVEVLSVSLSCDAGVEVVLLSAGWLDSASLQLYGPRSDEGWAFEETHPFPALPSDYEPSGAWDEYTLQLSPAAADGESEPGVSTVADCAEALSWVVQVQGGEESDCVAGGSSADELSCRQLSE